MLEATASFSSGSWPVQQRHNALGCPLWTRNAGPYSQVAAYETRGHRGTAGAKQLRTSQTSKLFSTQHRRCHPARIFKAAAPLYDLDDYEWDEQRWSGVTASSSRSSVPSQPTNSSQAQHSSSNISSSAAEAQQHGTDDGEIAGGGLVGLFVAGWMAVIALGLKLMQPVGTLLHIATWPLNRLRPAVAQRRLNKLAADLPEGWWARLNFLWEQPVVKSIRITLSVANWSVRLPVLMTVLLTQGSLLASQVSLPVLAPLLLGTGMMMNSIKANASFIIPRLGLLVVLLWMLWFVNSVMQTTWMVLRNQGRIDARTMSGARMITECTSLLLAGIVVLSMLGINVNALLLPTGVVLAIASKDLLQNLIAGFYLVLVQPFRLGDRVAVSCNLPSSSTQPPQPRAGQQPGSCSSGNSSSGVGYGPVLGGAASWFEGVCEKVDLRYTVLRDGRRRLMVPNTAFVSREFLVYDDGVPDSNSRGYDSSSSSSSPWQTAHNQQQSEHSSSSTGSSRSSSLSHPYIREGHMTTELPPLSPPIFPGVWPQPVGYPHYPHPQQYPPAAAYYTQQLQPQEQQWQQEQRQDTAAGDGEQQGSQQAVQQAAGKLQQHAHQQQQQDQQQQDQHKQQRQRPGSSEPAARGPPGYMPQGYYAPGLQYVGIPLYYGLPGMLEPWGGSTRGTSGQQQQQPGQRYQQHWHQESPGMHQPIPLYQTDGHQAQVSHRQQHQQHTQRPVDKQHMQRAEANTSDNARIRKAAQQQRLSSRHGSGAAPLSQQMVKARRDGSSSAQHAVTTQQPHNIASGVDLQQQAAQVAAVGSVGGYGYWSHDGVHPGAYMTPPGQHDHQPQRDSTALPGTQQLHGYSTMQAPWTTVTSLDQGITLPSPPAAVESGAAAGVNSIAVLHMSGAASAAAAAVAGTASGAAQLSGPTDAAAAAAVTAAQMIAAGGQAAQVVHPLLGLWHDLGLGQLHEHM